MKKITILLLALILSLSLTACSEEVAVNTNSDTPPLQLEETTDIPNKAQTESAEEVTPPVDIDPEISFDELTVVDNDECSIKITAIDPDNMWGYTLKALFENKSTDRTYMFSVEYASINGVLSDPFFATEVSAGKKSNNEINFSDAELGAHNIGDYTDIELTFRVYDSDNWDADDVTYETVHVYPYGPENAVEYVRQAQSDDNIIADNEYVTAIVTGYDADDFWGYAVNLYLENKSDKNVIFTVEEASVNGFMADPFYGLSVPAGKCAFSSMSWFDTTFEENGITDVEEIEFNLRVYDEDDWYADDLLNEIIVLNP